MVLGMLEDNIEQVDDRNLAYLLKIWPGHF